MELTICLDHYPDDIGWLDLKIELSAEESIGIISFSYIRDSVTELVKSAVNLLSGSNLEYVLFQLEPSWVLIEIQREKEEFTLKEFYFNPLDDSTAPSCPKMEEAIEYVSSKTESRAFRVNAIDFVKELDVALTHFMERYTLEEYRGLWEHEFPINYLKQLRQLVSSGMA